VIADFSEPKSIIVADQEHTIEINSDRTVLVDNQPVELPVTKGSLEASVFLGAARITTPGIRAVCGVHLDQTHGYCTVTIDGYLFGHTKGLLGTFNNEAYDDQTTLGGEIEDDIKKFANSWKVNKNCVD